MLIRFLIWILMPAGHNSEDCPGHVKYHVGRVNLAKRKKE